MAEPAYRVHSDRALLRRLSVRDFRNLAHVDLDVPAEGFAVVGENGHGKTNLLEAVYYLQLQRSFRGARDVELVRFGASAFHIGAGVHGGKASIIGAGFDRAGRRKKVVLDGVEVSRLSDAIGALPSVIFSPADLALVGGGPGERRRYLDVVLSLTSRIYLHALQRYRAALGNRNAALRQHGSEADAESRVTIWDPALAQYGAIIWRERARWVAAHAAAFSELCAAIGEQAPVELHLVSQFIGDGDPETLLLQSLERRRRVDLLRGVTHSGPHRDDLGIVLGGRDLRTYGSAGQQRTAAIALRLLEAATIRADLGREPVILLDDPFAELDVRRSAAILELLRDAGMGQTLLVVPRASDIPSELTALERWTVRNGAIER